MTKTRNWAIKKGDLVKVRIGGSTHTEDTSIYRNGIVLEGPVYTTENQIKVWPSVKVFIFKGSFIRNCLSGSVEILSKS
jgi:hypothetical protein|tara:strand:- start:5199 stop:5435 length:237 start_codon:yes stop_codon:yes gene_type:complete